MGALVHCLQHYTPCKPQNCCQVASKWPPKSGNGPPLGFWVLQTFFAKNIDDGEEKEMRKKKERKDW